MHQPTSNVVELRGRTEIDLGTDGVAIIGGGISGLALLAGLRRAGVRAHVFERARGPDTRGMGFILMSNGIMALQSLLPDVDPAEYCSALDCASMRWSDGASISRSRLRGAVSVLRPELIARLTAAAPQKTIHYDFKMISGEWHESQLSTVRFSNGSFVRAGAFVGCDGVRSQLRRMLHPEASLRPAGYREIVSSVEAAGILPGLDGTFTKFHDRRGGLTVGVVPTLGRVIWFAQLDSSMRDLCDCDVLSLGRNLRQVLSDWPPLVRELLDRTDFSESHLFAAADLEPLPNFHGRNVALIGDAAHPILSFTSQGASSAIEDALLLTDLLRETCSSRALSMALARFDAIRRPQARGWVAAGRHLYAQFLHPTSEEFELPLVN